MDNSSLSPGAIASMIEFASQYFPSSIACELVKI